MAVAYAYYRIGATDNASRVADRALDVARTLAEPRKRSDALADAALVLHRMKQSDSSKAAFAEATTSAEQTADDYSRAYAFAYIAEKQKQAGSAGAAQTMLDKADAAAKKVTDTSLRNPLMEKLRAQRSAL
jgi:ATP/maltotriose-dependent transcriptional regulator MalT